MLYCVIYRGEDPVATTVLREKDYPRYRVRVEQAGASIRPVSAPKYEEIKHRLWREIFSTSENPTFQA